VLFFFFGGHSFLILCVYAIRKNTSKQKEKPFFTLRFLPIAGRRKGKDESIRAGSKDKEQCTHRINSNLPGGSIVGERVLLFLNRGKSLLFYKKQ